MTVGLCTVAPGQAGTEFGRSGAQGLVAQGLQSGLLGLGIAHQAGIGLQQPFVTAAEQTGQGLQHR